MRYAPRRDANEPRLIEYLRRVGASVTQLDDRGVPDLLVGYKGHNLLFEVKSEKGKLTEDQVSFFDSWLGQRAIVRNIKDIKKELRKMKIGLGVLVKLKEDYHYRTLTPERQPKVLPKGTEGRTVSTFPGVYSEGTMLMVQFNEVLCLPFDTPLRLPIPEKIMEVVND